jgi:threonine dehydratase
VRVSEQSSTSVSIEDIQAAQGRISAEAIRTPLVLSAAASDRARCPVYLKLENLQRTGSFKVRGALNTVMSLTPEERGRGLICASSGNHGLGLAYAAMRFGVPCVVVLPERPNPLKRSLLEKLGADIVEFGINSDIQWEKVQQLSHEKGYTQVHPFSAPKTIAGQGTVGLEILEDLPDVDEIYVAIGGGGLISGIALAIREMHPQAKVYGVEPENSNVLSESVRHQKLVVLPKVETIADGLAAKATGHLNLSIIRRCVDRIILVSDLDILRSTLFLLEEGKILVEPSGATSFAGMLANPKREGRAVVVLSGGNVTLEQLSQLQCNLGGVKSSSLDLP